MEAFAESYRRKQREDEARRRRAEDFLARAAGNAAGLAGAAFGVGRGVYHDGEAVVNGVGAVANAVQHPKQAAAAIGTAVNAGADYARTRIADPRLFQRDVSQWGAQANVALNPDATARAPDTLGELRRRFEIGANQGETVYNVASLAVPVAGELKGGAEALRFARSGPLKYVEMGATPGQAKSFLRPYSGLGHHAYLGRNATWDQIPGANIVAKAVGIAPEKLTARIPKQIVDSPFNVLKPKVETGEFYRRHVGVDPDYHGGKVGRAFGGARWSGKELGFTKYDPLTRVWLGMPDATKAVATSLGGFDLLGRETQARRKPKR